LTLVGAVGCTVAWNPWVIILFRFITGIGAGGEYPLASVHMAESADRKSGARNVGFLYAFGSGFGQALCPLIAIIIVAMAPTVPKQCEDVPIGPDCNEAHNQAVWRGTFGVAAVFSLGGLILRYMTTKDSPNFVKRKAASPMPIVAKYWMPLISTAFSWFLYDVVEYGLKNNDVSIFAEGTTIIGALTTSFMSLMFSIPFLLVAALAVHYVSTKYCQLIGFVALAALNLVIATFTAKARDDNHSIFVALYILQTGFQAFVGITTFAIPAEVFPSQVRGTCHGISAFTGKIGAILGSYYFAAVKAETYNGPFHNTPTQYIFSLVTGASVLGIIVTMLVTPRYRAAGLEKMDTYVDADDHKSAIDVLYGKEPRNKLVNNDAA
jgi:MFS family permease